MPSDADFICATSAIGTFQGEPFVNVWHFKKRDLTTITVADLTALHGILDDAGTDNDAFAHLYQRWDAGLNINRLYSKTQDNAAPVELGSAVNINGASTGSDAQPLLSCLVKWTTDVAARSWRGRTYFTGFNTTLWNSTDTDMVDASVVTDFQTKVNEFVAAWAANTTWALVVFSRKEWLASNPNPALEVKAGAVQSRIAIQRRRSPGR